MTSERPFTTASTTPNPVAVSHGAAHDHELSLDAALEFLNTRELEHGTLVDHLVAPDDAAAWFAEHGVLHGRPAWTAADLERVRALRDALRAVVDAIVEDRAPEPAAIDRINAELDARPGPRLELGAGTVRVGHRHGNGVEEALAALASPIVAELADGRPDRFRTCASETCRWAFYDASPTGRRRWCDMKTCGNRAKAARFRERSKAGTQPAADPAGTESAAIESAPIRFD